MLGLFVCVDWCCVIWMVGFWGVGEGRVFFLYVLVLLFALLRGGGLFLVVAAMGVVLVFLGWLGVIV